eukprot:TRINITY_DN3007_c0_g1_i3.p1 TRINITY_DN3007_c0_g1~~TRINITY_DN3007_c0_g1_i3.p1  ORF type:complete len:313 (+),score=61.64 TRINITY_DN3007_c0_g1_i3:915-1853(+)
MLEGKGPIKEAYATGANGTIERRHLVSDPNWKKIPYRDGYMELQKFEMRDANITINNPNPRRTLLLNLFLLESDRLRQQWLLHDLINSKNILGKFDGSLFIYMRDRRTENNLIQKSILQIDKVNMDIVGATQGPESPLSWITSGSLDLVAEINSDPYFQYEDSNYTDWMLSIPAASDSEEEPQINIKFNIFLNNLTAAVPYGIEGMSYIKSGLIKSVVAFMNSNYTTINLNFPVDMEVHDFDGCWTPHDAGLLERIGDGVWDSMFAMMEEQKKPNQIISHVKTVLNSVPRGLAFMWRQVFAYYTMFLFNNQS